MKKIVKIIILFALIGAIFSALPLTSLYLKKDPPVYSNSEAVNKINNNTGTLFKFIVLGDNHAGLAFNDSTALKLIRNINKEDIFKKTPVDFVVILGDLTYRGSRWDWRIFNKIRSLIKWPVISLKGNHDDDKDDGSLFKKYVGDREPSFSDRNSYFISLDDSPGELTEEQLARVEEELKKAASFSHIFIFMHKGPISPYQQSWYRPELNPWSYRFMKLCEKYKVDIVFVGHEHMFKKQEFGGVKYITSGGGGQLTHFPSRDGGFNHYIVVRVYGDYVDYEVRKVFPPLWEFLTYYMWKDLFYLLKSVFL